MILLLSLWACHGSGDAQPSLVVEPAELTLTVRQGEPATQKFQASIVDPDGTRTPLDFVSWTSTNRSVGELDAHGELITVDDHGGVTDIVASQLDHEGSARVTVVYVEDLVQDDVDPALADAFEQASPVDSDDAVLIYPFDGVAVPRNLEGLQFWWQAPGDAVRLRLQSEITDLRVITTGSTWTATAALWARAAAANQDGQVQVTVEAGDWDGATLSDVVRSAPITVTVHRMDATGSVLYWETRSESIMRVPMGQTQAETFFTAEDAHGNCIGCHVVSNQNDRMVVSHDGIDGRFTVADISDPEDPRVIVESNDDRRVSWKTLSPDGRYLLATNVGIVALYDTATGQQLATWDLGDFMVMPDWSPDGERIAMVRVVDGLINDWDFSGGEIVASLIDVDALTLSEPTVLVPYEDGHNAYYPAWSPDGEWLAYDRTEGSCYSSPGAELWLTDKDGSVRLRLDQANGTDARKNSFPRWGPLPDDDVLWLAYSSLRDFPWGDEVYPQIWVSAIDLDAAARGDDPSATPFWLPGQEVHSDNHLPTWWDQ